MASYRDVHVGDDVAFGLLESPHLTKMGEIAQRSGDEPSEELRRVLASPLRHLTFVSAALYAAVIYVMVAKPFS